MSTRNVVDSSGWLEYLADTPRARLFAPALEAPADLVVPVLSIYEVYKKVRRERGERDALEVASLMQSGTVVNIDASLCLDAAELELPLADSLIYATARRHNATLWTQDEAFKGLDGVKYFGKSAK
jgi:predicted nucleic acid-binding protein